MYGGRTENNGRELQPIINNVRRDCAHSNRLVMSKRPSDLGSLPTPEPKYARQEPSPSRLLSSSKLRHFHQDLNDFVTPDKTDDELDLPLIHFSAHSAIKLSQKEKLEEPVNLDVFTTNVQERRADFFRLLRNAAQKGASDGDIHALVADSMCTLFSDNLGHECFSGVFWASPSPRNRCKLPNPFVPCNSLVMSCSYTRTSGGECFCGVAA